MSAGGGSSRAHYAFIALALIVIKAVVVISVALIRGALFICFRLLLVPFLRAFKQRRADLADRSPSPAYQIDRALFKEWLYRGPDVKIVRENGAISLRLSLPTAASAPASAASNAQLKVVSLDDSRVTQDLVKGLVQLGQTKPFAAKLAADVVRDLGGGRDFNDLFKEALRRCAKP